MAYYRFDDGGVTAQDSHSASFGDWNTGGLNAARLRGNTPPSPHVAFVDLGSDSPVSFDDDDTDGDGLPDWWELKYFDDLTVTDGTIDSDGDGLNDYYEYLAGTSPINQYTEGVRDIFGHLKSENILDADWDPDYDGLTNLDEQNFGTDPFNPDSDDDGVLDGIEMADFTSPLHSMNRLDPATGDNFINRYLVLANIGGGAQDGLEVPLAAADRVMLMPEWTVEAWVKAADPALASGALIRRAVGNNLGYELGLSDGVPYVMYQTAKKTSIGLDFARLTTRATWLLRKRFRRACGALGSVLGA